MRAVLVALAAAAVAFVLLFALLGGLQGPAGPDTTTHGREVAGFYGTGSFAGELLQSDTVETNTTGGGLSQSVVFQGKVCNRVPNLGRVFLDGAKLTDPDAYYRVTINGYEVFRHNMEVGDSSPLTGCFEFVQREYVISGAATGLVKAELVVYVFDFQRGAGGYETLAWDVAALR